MANRIDEGFRKRDVPISEFWGPNRLVVGWNSANQLARIVHSLRAKTILLVVDEHVLDDPLVQSCIPTLKNESQLVLHQHDGREPSLEGAAAIAEQCAVKVDVVIGIGGGSTIDLAKGAALAMATDKPLATFEGANLIDGAPVPVIAVPTTAGTGSEVTGSCVLSDEADKRKISIRSPKLLPRVAILDAHFLASVPPSVIRATGVDALAHALEAYFSTSGTMLTDTIALGAMSRLIKSLPQYYRNPADRQASENMAWGSCMAGIAFNSARVGLAHAIASAIGPLTGLSHGICVGLALPEAVRLNLKSRHDDRGDLLAHLGTNIAEDDWESSICAQLAKLYGELDFPKTVRDAGCSFQADDDLARRIVSSGRLETNPARITSETLRVVLARIHG